MDSFLPSTYLHQAHFIRVSLKYPLSCQEHSFFLCGILAVGILGATVMPHSLFLGSTLATQDRVSSAWKSRYPPSESSRSSSQVTILGPRPRRQRAIQAIKEYLSTPFRTPPPNTFPTRAQRYEDRENNSFEFISAHIYHGMVDMMLSLLGFAVMINALLVNLFVLWILQLILACIESWYWQVPCSTTVLE